MLEDFLEDYWSICLENESDEASARGLTDAKEGNGANGYSFGVKQFDLYTNSEAGRVLADLLESIVGAPDSPVTVADVAQIRANALKATAVDVRADPILDALRERADAGLRLVSSERLEEATRREMLSDVEIVLHQLDGLSDVIGARTFMTEGAFGRLFLVDYENLYGTTLDKFLVYFAGGTAPLNGGLNPVTASEPFEFRHIVHYLLNTRQGCRLDPTGRADVLRRLDTVIRIAERRDGAAMSLTQADRSYLRDTLRPILEDNGVPGIEENRQRGAYGALLALIARAD